MENHLSHGTLSKKMCSSNNNNGGFSAKKTVLYDDVFGGPPKFGAHTFSPRVEDYSEIFGGFHASRGSSATIPVLDLPAVDEAEVCFDVRSSMFDYSEVFGGFDGFDFAFSCDELLFDQANGGAESSSEEEAWSPAETESLSEKSAPSAHSGKSQSSTNGESRPSFDGIEQFNISYHEANDRSKDDMPNGTHVTQAPIIPGFTFLVDEIMPSQMMEDRNAFSQGTDDINLDMDFIEKDIGRKHLRKTMSHPANNTAGIHTLGKDINSLRSYSQNGSSHDEMFLTVAEISLRTHPSQLPPPSRPPPVKKGDSGGLASDLKGTKNYAFEGITGNSSPPFFDVEVDASSSAAASAAAMKEAMEQAQAKLKSAKELMERKKEGLQSRAKVGSKGDIKDKKGNMTKMVDGYNNLNEKRVHGTHEEEDDGMKILVGEERQKATKTNLGVPYSVEGEEFFDVVEISKEKKGKEFSSTEAAGEWKEANDFFELVKTENSRNTIKQGQQGSNGKIQVENTKPRGHPRKEKKIAMEASEQQEENPKKINAARAACELEENEKKLKSSEEARKQEDHEKKVNVAPEFNNRKEDEKKFKVTYEHSEKNLAAVDVWNEYDTVIKVQPEESYVEFEETMNQTENNPMLKVSNDRMVNDNRLKESRERRDNEKRLKETFEREEYKKRLRQAFELEETEERSKQDLEREELEKRLKEVHEQDGIEKKWKEAYEREENERRLKESIEQEENEKRLKANFERKENEKKQKEARERAENEKKLKEAFERKENEKRLKEALERKENEKKQKEACERAENEKKLKEASERKENEKRLKEALERKENEKEAVERKLREAIEREEYEKRQKEVLDREEVEKRLREACKRERIENRLEECQKRQESEKIIEEVNGQEGTRERSRQNSTWEEGKKSIHDGVEWVKLKGLHEAHDGTVRDENEKIPKLVQGTRAPMDTETLRSSNDVCKIDGKKNLQADEGVLKNEVNSVNLEATQEISAEEVCEKISTDPEDGESVVEAVEKASVPVDDRFEAPGMVQCDLQADEVHNSRVDDIRSVLLDESVNKSGQAVAPPGQTSVEGNMKESHISLDPKDMADTLTREWGERGKNIGPDQVVFDQELNKDKFGSTQMVNEGIENGKKTGAAPSSMSEGKRNIKRLAQHVINTSKSTERKGKNALKLEEREKEERMKRDKELEQDRLRKLEEEREREREREKDRMAVERATLEVRERAYAESRERAERAFVEKESAEARQRSVVEARERLEKACAELREKSSADKTSMEARIRAERAAVERATAEARERAAEKAAFEARERAERSASTSSSRYPFPSTNAVSVGKFEGVEGESAQRCKARLERHQRTTERAAKALAEKNTRDLVAQREQAERNRLAESLDADVRRWSSGKERNLRALLSTLQYILGPDSRWQPVPLTDVITAAAVKKAYRKATLCVHPDKLQQRGASIRHKYICEKVFDLLKEAWNKFNSEER